MTRSNSSSSGGEPGDSAEFLAPLIAAQPTPSSGRVRSLDEARRALRIPTSAAAEVLRAWGVPNEQLVAFVVDGDEHDLVAEFACLLVLHRDGSRLRSLPPGAPLRLAETGNALWVAHGSVVKAVDEALVIGDLSVGPAFDLQAGDRGNDAALGVTAELLRLISPTKLLSQTIDYLNRLHRIGGIAAARATAEPVGSERAITRAPQVGRGRRSSVSDELLAQLAMRYITLYRHGQRQPLPQLAHEFGITRTQARDRIHRARQDGWLGGGQERRAGGEPGPRLLERGWRPPDLHPAPDTEAAQPDQRSGDSEA